MIESPAPLPALDADALSEILNTIRLRGEHLFRTSAPAGDSMTQLEVPLIHIIESGSATLADGSPVRDGDLLLIPRGFAHDLKPETDLRWMTATVNYQPSSAADRLFSVLPPIMVLRSAPRDPREWLDVSCRLMVQEVIDPLPGGSVMVSRIIDLLFIQTLRAWSRETSQPAGWLRAVMDPDLGAALAALHRQPGHPWTVASLASAAHMSRSTFAHRFTELAGQSPMHYLADRRLDHARDLLETTQLPVHAISPLCGYTSEAAFSRAFSRHHGVSPRQWRQTWRLEATP